MKPTCGKCSHAVIVDGDELYCPRCGWIGYLPAPEPKPVAEELKGQSKTQELSKGVKHDPRLCHACERVIVKPTKHADLCVDCMRLYHSWLKNGTHLKPPPYLVLPSGRWWPNPFRILHHKIISSTDLESIETITIKLLEAIHEFKNTPLPAKPTTSKADSRQQPGGKRPKLAPLPDGSTADPGRRTGDG